MAKKSKPSLVSRLRGQIRTLENAYNQQRLQLAAQSIEIEQLKIRLQEARRRTVPMAGGGDLNFLPLNITRVETHHPLLEIESSSGARTAYVSGKAYAIITADGDVVVTVPHVSK